MKRPKKSIIIIAIVIIILLITNPSYTKFDKFSKDFPVKNNHVNVERTLNLFLFSIYTKKIAHTWNQSFYKERIGNIETIKYLGILSNFFEISHNDKDDPGHPLYQSQ